MPRCFGESCDWPERLELHSLCCSSFWISTLYKGIRSFCQHSLALMSFQTWRMLVFVPIAFFVHIMEVSGNRNCLERHERMIIFVDHCSFCFGLILMSLRFRTSVQSLFIPAEWRTPFRGSKGNICVWLAIRNISLHPVNECSSPSFLVTLHWNLHVCLQYICWFSLLNKQNCAETWCESEHIRPSSHVLQHTLGENMWNHAGVTVTVLQPSLWIYRCRSEGHSVKLQNEGIWCLLVFVSRRSHQSALEGINLEWLSLTVLTLFCCFPWWWWWWCHFSFSHEFVCLACVWNRVSFYKPVDCYWN